MPLSDRQIERYSRQIIVPGIGGIGQERLLGATLALCGEPADLEEPLAYLVGAGVGTIRIAVPGSVALDARIEDLRSLNPDSRIVAVDQLADAADLTLTLVGSAASLEIARSAIDSSPGQPLLIARLDTPARIAMLAASPCPLCADTNLLDSFDERSEQADFVAMLATVEALSLLSQQIELTPRRLEFDGYAAHESIIAKRAGVSGCRCESTRSGDA
jgi:hypothetical protein